MVKRNVTVLMADSFEEYTADELGTLIAQAKEIAKFAKGAETYAKNLLKANKPVTGWAMGKTARSRVWISEEKAKEAMAACGINDFYAPQTILSVPEAEKKLNKEQAEQLESAWEWKEGNDTLVPATKAALQSSTTPVNYGF